MLIVDAGPLVATADRADKDHARCRELLESDEGPLITTAMVIAEAGYLIDRQLGAHAEAALYESIISGELEVAGPGRDDWERMAELVAVYADNAAWRNRRVRDIAGRAAWHHPDRHPEPQALQGRPASPRSCIRAAAMTVLPTRHAIGGTSGVRPQIRKCDLDHTRVGSCGHWRTVTDTGGH